MTQQNGDIIMMGIVMYVGPDAAARSQSAIVTGSDLITKIINDRQIDIGMLLNRVSSVAK
jgi:hypothetical protein